MIGKVLVLFFFFQAEDGIRDHCVTGVQTCALPIWSFSTFRANPLFAMSRSYTAAAGGLTSEEEDGGEIGRASCRERV